MIQGSTLFLGDSITVGLAGLVPVDGARGTLAEGGQTSGWLLKKVRGLPDLPSYKNAFVLIGTNDVGGDASAESIYDTVWRLYNLLSSAGVRVYGATVPPFRGYAGYASRFDAIEAKRRRLNDHLRWGSIEGVRIIDLDRLMADPSDPSRLAARFDGGDHLHPRKDMLARLLDQEMSAGGPSPRKPGRDLAPPQVVDGLALATLAVSAATGYALWKGWRPRLPVALTRKAF